MLKNRFLRTSDLNDSEMKRLKLEFDEYYVKRWRGTPHPWGSKNPNSIVTHWSREWEYPWAVINSEVKKEDNVLDCGCGGAPLLPYLVERFECFGYGIDLKYGDLMKDYNRVIDTSKSMATLRHFVVDPSLVVWGYINIKKQSMINIEYPDGFFDKVFCISVIEHMEKDVVEKSMKEMVRVLKPGGKLLMTIDHTSHKGHAVSYTHLRAHETLRYLVCRLLLEKKKRGERGQLGEKIRYLCIEFLRIF